MKDEDPDPDLCPECGHVLDLHNKKCQCEVCSFEGKQCPLQLR